MGGLFLDNMEMRTIYNRTAPHTLVQGNTPVHELEYADQLRERDVYIPILTGRNNISKVQ